MNADGTSFTLDPRLASDTFSVVDMRLCSVLLMNDARFPWLILVPRRAGLADLIDLTGEDRLDLSRETDTVSRALKAVTSCDKLNVAALGNMVRQLHIHVIARSAVDVAWPAPVWGVGERMPYTADDAEVLMQRLRSELGGL